MAVLPEKDVVLFDRRELEGSSGSVAIVTLNRPRKHNCFNREVVNSLSLIFRKIANEVKQCEKSNAGDDKGNEEGTTNGELIAVIFTGKGRSFCAGADLSNPPDPLHASSDLPHCLEDNPIYQMSQIGIPIIGAVKGYVMTGGFELALGCDMLIGDASTMFKDTHTTFNLAPCWGLSQKLQRIIGPNRAKQVSLSAMPLTANKALQWGLLNEIVEEGTSVLDRAMEIAEEIGKNNSTMVRRYKRAMDEGGSMDLSHGLQRERELGIAHYLQALQDETFLNAKQFISNHDRQRSKL